MLFATEAHPSKTDQSATLFGVSQNDGFGVLFDPIRPTIIWVWFVEDTLFELVLMGKRRNSETMFGVPIVPHTHLALCSVGNPVLDNICVGNSVHQLLLRWLSVKIKIPNLTHTHSQLVLCSTPKGLSHQFEKNQKDDR